MKMLADPSVTSLAIEVADAWTDVDVTSLVGSDAGNVAGVYLRITATSDQPVGLRKNGTSGTVTQVVRGSRARFAAVAVDSGDVFEMYRSLDTATLTVRLVGYWTNDEAEFKDNWDDVSYTSAQSYGTPLDPSANFTGTPIGYIVAMKYNSTSLIYTGAQDVGGPGMKSIVGGVSGQAPCYVVPCTAGAFELSQGNTESYVIGAITAGLTKISTVTYDYASTDMEDVDLSASVPAGAVAHICHDHPSGTGNGDSSARTKDGRPDGEDYTWPMTQAMGVAEIWALNSTTRIAEHQVSSSSLNNYTIAYLTEPAAAGTPAGQIVITRYHDIAS